MRRAWICGLLLVLACAAKAPPEGAVRITVQYESYRPACVRVTASDDTGEKEHIDILQTDFKDQDGQLLRFAVFRKAEWAQTLTVEVSSFMGSTEKACSGTRLETVSKSVEVPQGDYAIFEAALRATDDDKDGYPALVEGGVTGLDCDDGRGDVYPGAEERCAVGVDYDCDGARGCQDTKCQYKTCDDGNACTTGEVCVGSGVTAQCLGQAKVCDKPAGACFTGATCSQATGECVPVRKQCPAPASVCLEGAGVCNEGTGNCEYRARPAATSCDDSQVCTTNDACDGQGSCRGVQNTCPVSSVCLRATGTCPAAGACGEEPDPTKVDAACTLAGESLGGRCRATSGKCSRFPYEPSHFDPDVIASASIVNLTTTCDVTFDSTALSWTPANCAPGAPQPIELTQGTGAVLLPILNLSLGGTLRLVGNRPVILAVFENATLNYDVLANGTGTTAPGAGGSVALACETRRGRGGVVGDLTGGGGGGAGGGLAGASGGKGSPVGASPGDGGGPETVLAGGCSGGSGGGPIEGGKGGVGGGMVQVSVARTLTVNKTISVSGGGGGGGTTSAAGEVGGGGGGGGGGRILLEAEQVTLANAARLTANGGGGGEAGAFRNANDRPVGRPGTDGWVASESAATGGTGGNNSGGDGGNGGARDRTAEVGKDSQPVAGGIKGGGGGGGGAVGVIRLRSLKPCVHNNAVISPNTDRQCPL